MSTASTARSLLRTCRQAYRSYHTPARILQTNRSHHLQAAAPPSFLRKHVASVLTRQTRFRSTDADNAPQKPLTDRTSQQDEEAAQRKEQMAAYKAEQPSYDLSFTCKQCSERSQHRISKQGYHHGTVLVTCPGCKNRHLISDHLKVFSDKGVTIEDIMREKGQLIKKGVLGADGDVEFYEDDTKAS